MENNFFHSI